MYFKSKVNSLVLLMRLRTCLPFLLLMTCPTLLYPQEQPAANFHARGLDEGFGKVGIGKVPRQKLSLDKWTYIQVDDSRDNYVIPGAESWWNYFGLDMFDVNQDEYMDIVAGEWFYRNPAGDMTSPWERITFPVEVDAVLALDVDG